MEQQDMQDRVQLAILREINAERSVGWQTISVSCPRSDERDYVRALDLLVKAGAVEGPAVCQELRVLAAAGHLTLTPDGQRRLDRDGPSERPVGETSYSFLTAP